MSLADDSLCTHKRPKTATPSLSNEYAVFVNNDGVAVLGRFVCTRNHPPATHPFSMLCLRWPSHQINKNLVEFLLVDIELHGRQPLIGRNRGLRIPEQSLAITRAMIDVDIHIELLLAGNDRRIDQGNAGDFVPHETRQRILVEIPCDRSSAFAIVAFISLVKCVFTEISIGVIVIFFHGARSTIRAALDRTTS